MAIATFTEASEILGYRSRSTLYHLKKSGLLDDYLVNVQRRDHFYLKSKGKSKSEDYVTIFFNLIQANLAN